MNGKSLLSLYLEKQGKDNIDSSAASFYASCDHINSVSPLVAKAIIKELFDQKENLKLIASENFCSLAVQMAQGNLFTDKYAEGYAEHRFYAGCENVDDVEKEASRLACKLFGAEYAYVQPHSGSDANLLAYLMALSHKIQRPFMEGISIDNPSNMQDNDWEELRKAFFRQKLFALDYYSGGHLTHGYRHNFSSMLFDVHSYTVNRDTYLINLDDLRKQIHEIKPLIFLAGYSSYPRKINFAKMREIADEVGAVFMVDMSHFAGLVAGKVFTGDYNPIPYAHIVTTTTHKTLRGPRGGVVMCKNDFAQWADKGCPIIQGGPLPHVIAAKAVAFKEALAPEFSEYAHKIVNNSVMLAEHCMNESLDVVTGGTDNHLLLVDVAKSFGITGRQAESALRDCGITLNRNVLPFDKNGPWYTSGLRLGTPAVTTLGMGSEEMKEIAKTIKLVLQKTSPKTLKSGKKSLAKYTVPEKIVKEAHQCVGNLLKKYPLYPNLDIEIIRESGITRS